MTTDIQSEIPHAFVGDHPVVHVTADGEPRRHFDRALSDLANALPSTEAMAEAGAAIRAIATSPDFHPGKPVPVGVTVDITGAILPHLVGNDIGCGMRLVALDGLDAEDIAGAADLDHHLRHVFFQGGRDLAMTGRNRRAILEDGVPGLLESMEGSERRGLLGRHAPGDLWADLDRTMDGGVLVAGGIDPGFEAYGAIDDDFRHDAILGSIGGGNHFVELGRVEQVVEGSFALACGIKVGTICLVVHSGSLDFGQWVGSTIAARPAPADRRDRRIVTMDGSDEGRLARYRTGLANAANIAFANRMTIAMASVMAIERATGKAVHARLVYDAPHNLAWIGTDGSVRHRKGSCPARGMEAMAGTPYAFHGEPVVLPGSMGDGTWLMVGTEARETLESSAHGAGRRLSRSEARVKGVVPDRLRVVGPVDVDHPSIRGRPDILADFTGRLLEESPSAYRPLDAIAAPMEQSGMARRAARIRPLVTVKG